jgi:type II secretory pathway component GspD/PulD (secretin)
MLSTRRRIFLALALALAAAPAAMAQGGQAKQEDEYVTQKMFQNRVFEIHNRDPQSIARVLSPLTSGFRGAVVSPNQEFHTISVRDFAENIAVIEETIRRLDTPEAPRPSIEFRVHMLVASNDDASAGHYAPYPAELSDVVRQLQSTLGYKNYSLMGSQVVRGKEGNWDVYNKGVADIRMAGDTPASKNPVFYTYNIRTVTLDNAGGHPRIQVGEFSMNMNVPLTLGSEKIQYQEVGFKNPVSLRDGERVVVGTTSIADKSVVVILTATTMK